MLSENIMLAEWPYVSLQLYQWILSSIWWAYPNQHMVWEFAKLWTTLPLIIWDKQKDK